MKKIALFFVAIILLLGSCASATPPAEEVQPVVTANLNANTPAREIIPGNNVELMKFDVATSGNVSVGNFQTTWQELKEPTGVSVQHLCLLKQDFLLDTTVEQIPYGEPTILLKDSSVQLDSQTVTTFSLKGDVAGEGNFSLTVSFKAYSSTGQLLSVENLPLTGGILIVPGAPAQQPEPSVRVTATLDGEPWEGPVIFDLSRNADFDGMDATGQYQVPKEFKGLYLDLQGGANVYIRLRQPEGFQSGPETAYLYGIVATNYGESDGSWIGPCPTPATFTFVFKTLPPPPEPPAPVPDAPKTFEVPGEYSALEAFQQAQAGDTILIGSGAYYLNGKGGWPILPGGVIIQGAGEKQTFLLGTIKSDGDLTNTTGDIIIKDLTILGPADSRAVISGGKRITLDNVTVMASGSVSVFAGWRDVSLKVNNSTFINIGNKSDSIGIEVAGELDPHDNLVKGNIFVNQETGLSVPTQNFDSFSKMVLEHNEFYGVETPVCRAAFG